MSWMQRAGGVAAAMGAVMVVSFGVGAAVPASVALGVSALTVVAAAALAWVALRPIISHFFSSQNFQKIAGVVDKVAAGSLAVASQGAVGIISDESLDDPLPSPVPQGPTRLDPATIIATDESDEEQRIISFIRGWAALSLGEKNRHLADQRARAIELKRSGWRERMLKIHETEDGKRIDETRLSLFKSGIPKIWDRIRSFDSDADLFPMDAFTRYLSAEFEPVPVATLEEIFRFFGKLKTLDPNENIAVEGIAYSVHQIDTREMIDGIADRLNDFILDFREKHRRDPVIREGAAGNGRLTRWLKQALKMRGIENLDFIATDKAGFRQGIEMMLFPDQVPMNAADEDVYRKDILEAVDEADMIIACWLPRDDENNNKIDVRLAQHLEANPHKRMIIIGNGFGNVTGSRGFPKYLLSSPLKVSQLPLAHKVELFSSMDIFAIDGALAGFEPEESKHPETTVHVIGMEEL